MNRNQFLAALAVLVVLAAAGGWVILSDRSDWKNADARAGKRVIAALKIADVAEISISDAEGQAHLVKGAAGWTLRERADFPADTDRIGELLVRLAEMKAVQSESVPEGQRARLELAEPGAKAPGAGTLVELKDAKGTLLARLLLGKKIFKTAEVAQLGRSTELPTGRYLVAGDDPKTLLVVADPLTQAESKPQEWLRKELLRVEGARSIASEKDGKPRWKVVRETESADWKFAGSKQKPDLQKSTDLGSSLGWIDLVDVVADPARADAGLEHGIVIKADTFDGVAYTLRIGNKAGDNYYVRFEVAGELAKGRVPAKGEKAEDKAKNDREFEERRKKLADELEREKKLSAWTYLVAQGGIAALLRDRAGLMPDRKPAKKS
jgi:Domain of unknown function (DUF4340)